MWVNLAAFLGVSILVIITPGQDTALTIRNTLVGGRGCGTLTAAGVASGQFIWTVASSAGLAALLVASEPAFTALKLLGAAYLIFLGGQALYAALRPGGEARANVVVPHRLGRVAAYRHGVLSNLGNPKMAVFFSSLLPQFIAPGHASFETLLLLGLLFNAMTLAWLTGYALLVARVGDVLRRDRVRRSMEAVTGLVLVGLGLRLVTERR
ncbi:MAG: LysE family translocator [Candidatus Dormibacteraeota bacterium]|nr:LysE family translocator [Candidatus Dormibacteraeota bacterium]